MISLEKDDAAVSESDVKAGMNGTNGLGMFEFPKIALPGLIGELAAQGVARAQQGCEEIKVAFASDEMREALRETYSSNARSAADYGLKVFEISNANTAAAINFLSHLWGSKSVTDVFSLTAAQTRKSLDTATAQNKELWGLAQKFATETGEPIKKHFAKVLHQAS